MIIFYTNRELSEKFSINLAKWKRWSREFLPPDPLGGMQSGYARQYNPKQAFIVYLGGHLVSDLKFSIPEAKQILADLNQWLFEKGFYFNLKGGTKFIQGVDRLVVRYTVYILRETNVQNSRYEFCYTIKGILSNTAVDHLGYRIIEKRYVETTIGTNRNAVKLMESSSLKVLNITGILKQFVEKLGQNPEFFPAIQRFNGCSLAKSKT